MLAGLADVWSLRYFSEFLLAVEVAVKWNNLKGKK